MVTPLLRMIANYAHRIINLFEEKVVTENITRAVMCRLEVGKWEYGGSEIWCTLDFG